MVKKMNKVYACGYDVDIDRLKSEEDVRIAKKFEPGSDVTPTIEDAMNFAAMSMAQGVDDTFEEIASKMSKGDVRYAVQNEVKSDVPKRADVLKKLNVPEGFDTWSDDEKYQYVVKELNHILDRLGARLDVMRTGVEVMNKRNCGCDKKGKICKCKAKGCAKRCVLVLPIAIVGVLVARGLSK